MGRAQGHQDKDFARRLRKGAGADPTASGATRVAGSLNFKDKYAPDFPRVAIQRRSRAATTRRAERLGLVAAPEAVAAAPLPARHGQRRRRWPSYERCLDGAPLKQRGDRPDISRADFVWCMTAIPGVEQRGNCGPADGGKHQGPGTASYADLTARNAALPWNGARNADKPRPQTAASSASRTALTKA